MNTKTLLITLAALVLAACGGEDETTESESQIRASQLQAPTAGNCGDVCSEVTACCICKCYEDYSWPLSTSCAVGCAVIAVGTGSDSDEPADGILSFKSADGFRTRALPYVVDRRRPSFQAVAGKITGRGAFKSVDGLSAKVDVVHLDEYLAADAEGRRAAYHGLRRSVVGRGSEFRAQLSLRGFVAGPYLLRLRSGRQTALTMVELN